MYAGKIRRGLIADQSFVKLIFIFRPKRSCRMPLDADYDPHAILTTIISGPEVVEVTFHLSSSEQAGSSDRKRCGRTGLLTFDCVPIFTDHAQKDVIEANARTVYRCHFRSVSKTQGKSPPA